jgi:predicted RNase H-like HicB family nuclease
MLSRYIDAAMQQATYEILEDGTFCGEIPPCPGVITNAETLEECRKMLLDALESWLLVGFHLQHDIPVIDGIDLNLQPVSQEVA